ncbi:hypothetical protein M404DRAFT_444761 [Pisolithus tinctorius Marx 270]|uniref:Uncharacterized protein n=1 Tax=Pisolithus tinctorius Marx 270 TaxID=870435 RepID=A0A0C3PXR4_PISTI|nr:hypothetical protein M404DRAFT_444761 [Pisolithus tinctorius Marx 270]
MGVVLTPVGRLVRHDAHGAKGDPSQVWYTRVGNKTKGGGGGKLPAQLFKACDVMRTPRSATSPRVRVVLYREPSGFPRYHVVTALDPTSYGASVAMPRDGVSIPLTTDMPLMLDAAASTSHYHISYRALVWACGSHLLCCVVWTLGVYMLVLSASMGGSSLSSLLLSLSIALYQRICLIV